MLNLLQMIYENFPVSQVELELIYNLGTPSVNYINVLAAFICADPKSVKIWSSC